MGGRTQKFLINIWYRNSPNDTYVLKFSKHYVIKAESASSAIPYDKSVGASVGSKRLQIWARNSTYDAKVENVVSSEPGKLIVEPKSAFAEMLLTDFNDLAPEITLDYYLVNENAFWTVEYYINGKLRKTEIKYAKDYWNMTTTSTEGSEHSYFDRISGLNAYSCNGGECHHDIYFEPWDFANNKWGEKQTLKIIKEGGNDPYFEEYYVSKVYELTKVYIDVCHQYNSDGVELYHEDSRLTARYPDMKSSVSNTILSWQDMGDYWRVYVDPAKQPGADKWKLSSMSYIPEYASAGTDISNNELIIPKEDMDKYGYKTLGKWNAVYTLQRSFTIYVYKETDPSRVLADYTVKLADLLALPDGKTRLDVCDVGGASCVYIEVSKPEGKIVIGPQPGRTTGYAETYTRTFTDTSISDVGKIGYIARTVYATWEEMANDDYNGRLTMYMKGEYDLSRGETTFRNLWNWTDFHEFGIEVHIVDNGPFHYKGRTCRIHWYAEQTGASEMIVTAVVTDIYDDTYVVGTASRTVYTNEFTKDGLEIGLIVE